MVNPLANFIHPFRLSKEFRDNHTPEEIAKSCPIEMIKYCWEEVYGGEFIEAKLLYDIKGYVFNCFYGSQNRTAIAIPPRHFKSEFIRGLVADCFGKNPSCKFLYQSFSHGLATESCRIIRKFLDSEKFRHLYGKVERPKDTEERFTTSKDGLFLCGSELKPFTGFGAGRSVRKGSKKAFNGAFIIDDGTHPLLVHSDAYAEKSERIFYDTNLTRLNDRQTPFLIAMQVVGRKDRIANVTEANERLVNKGRKPVWKIYKRKAYDEANEKILLPELYSYEDLMDIKDQSPITWEIQYQGNPYVLEGDLFKADYFKYYKYNKRLFFDKRIISIDSASQDNPENDFSVFQIWGVLELNAYLIDQKRGKWQFPDLIKNFQSFYDYHNRLDQGVITRVHTENKSSGIALIQTIQSYTNIPIVPINPKGSKYDRALPVSYLFEKGRVLFPEGARFLGELELELLSFSKLSKGRKDQVDATVYGVSQSIGAERSKGVFLG